MQVQNMTLKHKQLTADQRTNKYCREVFLKWNVQYSLPPSTNLYNSATFDIGNMIYLFYKTSYLNKDVNCTELSP
jgi:hypothetical protein